MKFKVGDIVKTKNGSEYTVEEVGSIDALGEYERVLIKGKTGIGYWFSPTELEYSDSFKCKTKDVETMTEEIKIGDMVMHKRYSWAYPSEVIVILGNDVAVANDERGLTVFKKHLLVKAKKYPYTLTKEEMDAHLKTIGTDKIMVNIDKIKEKVYTIKEIVENGPGFADSFKFGYFFENGGMLQNGSIGPDNGHAEYLWYMPHELTEHEKRIIIKQFGSLKFHIEGWGNTVFEVTWYGHPGTGMYSFRVKYASTDDAQVPIEHLMNPEKSEDKRCTWIDERRPLYKAEGVGYFKRGEGSKLVGEDGCPTSFNGTPLGEMATQKIKVKMTIEEIRD